MVTMDALYASSEQVVAPEAPAGRSKQCRTPRKIRCLGTFFEMASATACHRGEVLALRWCDIRNDAAFVDRSLCQTRDGLTFKSTTTERSEEHTSELQSRQYLVCR